MITCEMRDCEHTATHEINGVALCNRCGSEYVSVGLGVTRFNGVWHGVRGARYTAEQCELFPGCDGGRGPLTEEVV